MVRILLLLVSVVIVAACVRNDRAPTYTIPKSDRFLGVFPYDKFKQRYYQNQVLTNTPGNPKDSYAMGYQAGCQTMNSVLGENFARVRGANVDPDKLTNDAWYLRGYEDGGAACASVLDWENH